MPSSTLEATPPPTDLTEVLGRFRTDLGHYAQACLKIRTKDARLVWFDFNEPQRIVQAKLAEQRRTAGRVRAVVLKARQEGVSTLTAARFYRRVHLWSQVEGLVVADLGKRSVALFRMYERFDANLPLEVRKTKVSGVRGKRLEYADGSAIQVETAKDLDAGRALTIQVLHCSEVGFWDHAEDTMLSLLQAVPLEGSEIVVESTANGVGNYFHQLWKDAEAGDSGWVAIFLPWWIHREYQVQDLLEEEREAIEASADPFERKAQDTGIEWEERLWKLSPGQLAWRRRIIRDNFKGDERAFRQEYPATAREAFLVSGAAFFDEEKLLALEEAARAPVARGELIRVADGLLFRPAERGYLRIFERPSADGHYVIGADTAEGRLAAARDSSFSDPEGERGGRDFCSADVLRVGYHDVEGVWHPPRQVAQFHGRMAPEVFAEGLALLGYFYGCPHSEGDRDIRRPALEAVERNHSSGQTVLYRLRQVLRYPNLYWRRVQNQRTERVTAEIGWVTSGETRPLMLDELAAAVRTDAIGIPCAETVGEMLTFVRADDGRPEAQEGCHDDRVISLAIAMQMLREHRAPPKGEVPPTPVADTPTGM